MDKPIDITGENWIQTTPHKLPRFEWYDDVWNFVIRDVSGFTYRVHAYNRETGQIFTFARDNNGQGQDGFQPLFGAAYRLYHDRCHPTDTWKEEQFPSILGSMGLFSTFVKAA